ncbi:hypothetical protein FOA52_007315 [Chlamydomonas sp. UWO 241]|nr:hypothetical protein FOA52_007315 [Chlamydomonas sp. UWO 241]
MAAAIVKSATKALGDFKNAYSKNDVKKAEGMLDKLKLQLIQLTALPPMFEQTATAKEELALARDVYEHAAFYSLRTKDDATMERCFAQLKSFYADTRSMLPASPQESTLLGLDLLRLLVQNRIAEFHTELELIPTEAQSNPGVQYAIQLEQWLMEGAYNKVLEAAKKLPSDAHALLVQQIASTVREEIASCSERAYDKLKLADAQKMMMLGSEKELKAYVEEHGWHIDGGYIRFVHPDAAANAAKGAKDEPSLKLISNSLVYAKELERIV